jgi:hypothetical protein
VSITLPAAHETASRLFRTSGSRRRKRARSVRWLIGRLAEERLDRGTSRRDRIAAAEISAATEKIAKANSGFEGILPYPLTIKINRGRSDSLDGLAGRATVVRQVLRLGLVAMRAVAGQLRAA